MSTIIDVEKAVPDEEKRALLGTRNEGRPDDGEQPNRADDMELAELKQPGPSSSNIANGDGPHQVLKETNESEEFIQAVQNARKQCDQNTRLLNSIDDHNNMDVIRQPGPSSSNIANGDDPHQVLKGTNESEEFITHAHGNGHACTHAHQCDNNISALSAITTMKDVIRYLENVGNPDATYPTLLTTECHIAAFSNEVALRLLQDIVAEIKKLDTKNNSPGLTWPNSPRQIVIIPDFSVEENCAVRRARNEGRPDDGEHSNRVDDMELTDFEQPGPSSSNIANGDDPVLKGTKSEDLIVQAVHKHLGNQTDKNTRLLNAIYDNRNEEVLSLLKSGASPNATCRLTLLSACHIAAFCNEEALRILLDAGAERNGLDTIGNTPIHYAAWANSPKKIAMILDFPEGLTNEVTKVNRTLTPKQEAEIQEIGARSNSFVNNTRWYKCFFFRMFRIPIQWITNMEVKHNINVPNMLPGHSALHVASATAHPQCVRLLLAAGANPNLRDESSLTPLDVAGSLYPDNYVETYVETLQLIRKYGGTLSGGGTVLETALRKRSLPALTLLLGAGAPINYQNPSGYTPLHLCVELRLKEHLEVLANHSSPEMNYRAVDVTDKDGSTVLHWAARERWSDGVTVALLAMADIGHENSMGDTALHLAAKAGDYVIVKKILEYDLIREWDFSKENVNGESLLINAILSGNADIVMLMLGRHYHAGHSPLTCDMRHRLNQKVGNLAPLKYEKNFQNFWELITKLDNNNVIEDLMNVMTLEKYTLHKAIKHSNRQMINVLLQKGADLSQPNEDGQTAISLLMYHVTKPTEFMTEILDGCIKTDKNIYDKDCVITINYSVLMPNNEYEERNGDSDPLNAKAKDMKVLEALIETGDVYDQRSLLTHPVVESFLYLKWKKCAKFIYFLISVYVIFLISLNTFIATIYYHMDHLIEEQDISLVFNPIFWRFFALFTLFLFSLVDIFFWSSSKMNWRRSKTIWVKFFLTVGSVIMLCIPMDATNNDIIRGVSVITVSLSWIYLMINLSWTPTLGYYMQMYGKVSKNVMKVMLSFSFPLVGFSICFMILLRSKEPFDGPIAAFLKTMVMMSSEFEYESLVKNSTLDSLKAVFMLRTVFLLFFICVAIVLMNLMLGVAVSDYQELSLDGKQRRLMKQVECITTLEKLFQRKRLSTFKLIKMKTMKFNPNVKVTPDSNIFGREMKEIILNKAQSLIETEENKADDVKVKAKIDDIFDLTKKLTDLEKKLSEMTKSVNKISEAVELKDAADDRTIDKAVNRILEVIAKQRTDGPIV